jgi:hypothetical protein
MNTSQHRMKQGFENAGWKVIHAPTKLRSANLTFEFLLELSIGLQFQLNMPKGFPFAELGRNEQLDQIHAF